MICPGGLDANGGCPIPATCMPMTGREFLKKYIWKQFPNKGFKDCFICT